jgi:hypothetical protein
MNSIVVYRILIVSWFLILASGLTAQKPTIDLISSHHQYRHPEAIVDTGYAVRPRVKDAVLTQLPPAQNQDLASESVKKRRRQIGPSLDSIFQKEETRAPGKEKSPAKISLFNRRYNPIKILIYITALK